MTFSYDLKTTSLLIIMDLVNKRFLRILDDKTKTLNYGKLWKSSTAKISKISSFSATFLDQQEFLQNHPALSKFKL